MGKWLKRLRAEALAGQARALPVCDLCRANLFEIALRKIFRIALGEVLN